jgi:hypothetical protein
MPSVIFTPLQTNELTEGFIEIFLEPVLQFAATRSADFVNCRMSRAILETCLGHFHESDSVLSIGSLCGFLVVIEPDLADTTLEFAVQFLESSPELSTSQRAFFALIDIATACHAATKTVPSHAWLERMLLIVKSGLVMRLGHHCLFAYVFVMACAREANSELMPIVSGLFGSLNRLREMEARDRAEMWGEEHVPSVMSVLTLEWEYETPYERLDVNEFLGDALGHCES